MGFVSGLLIMICIVAIVAVTVFVAYKIKEMNTDYDNKIKTLSSAVNVGMSNAAQYDMRQQNQLNILNTGIQRVNSNIAQVGNSNIELANRINFISQSISACNASVDAKLAKVAESNAAFSNTLYRDVANKSTSLSNVFYTNMALQTTSNNNLSGWIVDAGQARISLSNDVYSRFGTQANTNTQVNTTLTRLSTSNSSLSNATFAAFTAQATSNTNFIGSFATMDQRFTLISASNRRFADTLDMMFTKNVSPSNLFTQGLYTTSGVLIGQNSNGFIDLDTNGSTRIGYKNAAGVTSSISINQNTATVTGNLNVMNGITSGKNINVTSMGPLGSILENNTNGTRVGVSGSNNTARLYTTGTNSLGLGYITDNGTGYSDALRISREGPSYKTNIVGKLCFDDGTTCLDASVLQKLLSNGVTGPSSSQNIATGSLIRRRINMNRTDLYNTQAMNSAFNNLTADEIVLVSSFTLPNADNFGMEYTGWIVVPTTGLYSFGVRSDDSSDVAIYQNSWLVLATAYGYKGTEPTPPNEGPVNLVANQLYPIRIRFYEKGGAEQLILEWKTPANSTFTNIPFTAFRCDGTTPPTLQSIRNNFPDPRVS